MEDAGRSGMGLAALQLVGPTADATAFPGPEDTQEASNRGVGAKTVGALLGHVAGQHGMARTAASYGHRVALIAQTILRSEEPLCLIGQSYGNDLRQLGNHPAKSPRRLNRV
jgi:hypothetical protein